MVVGNGPNRDQEDDRQADQQDRQRDLIRGLLTLGAFDQRDHAIEKALTRLLRDAHLDRVGNDAGARRHCRTVAAGLADHRRAFARDRALVDRCDALDHLSIGGDQVAGLDQHQITFFKQRCTDQPPGVADADQALGLKLRLGRAERCGLCAAPALGQRLGKGAEQYGQPQPHDQLDLERDGEALAPDPEQHGQQQRNHGGDEQHRVADKLARIELLERVADRREDQVGGEHGFGGHQSALRRAGHGPSRYDRRWVQARARGGRSGRPGSG